MRICVTGASGFIGAHFIERALTAGHAVTGLYRSEQPQREPLLHHLRSLGAKMTRAELLDADSSGADLTGCEVVCHFAAAFKEAEADEQYFERVNVEGTARLLKVAARHGVKRFVFCSTAGIYGRSVDGVIDERATPRPWNMYERSKLAAEQRVREHAGKLGMEYVILRPSVVYGPRDTRLSKLFRTAVKGRFPLFGPGKGRRHMVYVTDVAEAFLRACTQPSAANQEVIVAGPEAVQLREMLQTLALLSKRRSCGPRLPLTPMLRLSALTEDICKSLRIKPPIYRRRMDFYLSDAAFDCGRAREVLQWEPKIGLEEGLARTLHAQEQLQRQPAAQAPVTYSGVANVLILGTHAISHLQF